jgi:extradiol dioxygenase family protein
MDAIFHLSFPVTSLAVSLGFYERVLGGVPGRRTPQWGDVIVFGHQLTLHEQPAQVRPRDALGVHHFGAILRWDELLALRARIEALDPPVPVRWLQVDADQPGEHAKLLLEDPDGTLVEIKAYRSLATVAAALGVAAND